MVAARRNSPLVVGLGEGENFLGSDVAAFIEHTREALELGQDQVVTITRDDVRGHRLRRQAGARARRYHVDWDLSAAEKDGFDWFMRKEIFEQPRAVADALLGRHDGDAASCSSTRCGSPRTSCATSTRSSIIGCGTANYAGLVAKYAIEHWTRIPCEVELAHEFRYRDPILTRNTLVVAISQSGETADTLMAIRYARQQRAQGAGDLQHQRLDDPARVRRGDLHPRRSGDRGRLDQGLPDPADRLLPARPLPRPGARHQVRRRDRLGASPSSSRCPGHVQRMLDQAESVYDARAPARRAPGRCCSSVATPASRSRSRVR